MPMYEFQCPRGHVTEELVPIGTKIVVCRTCRTPCAERILSATPTTFHHADVLHTRKRNRVGPPQGSLGRR